MNLQRFSLAFILILSLAISAAGAAVRPAYDAITLPVSTKSPEAARAFESAMVHYENHRWHNALDAWNEALKFDPDLAQAYVWISFTTGDPAEESRDRAKAESLINSVTPGEQLLIRWLAGVRENRYLEGIVAMNDLLAMFPHDKRLHFMIGYWLFRSQDEYDTARKVTLQALAEDADYATAYNQLAYIYSRVDNIDKALEFAAKYLTLLPNEPNPHDSYAEMLRFAGRYQEALAQYHLALKIDPGFYISQKELGETYALMGDEAQARKEYAKAIEQVPINSAKAEYALKLALTYVREKKYRDADTAYRDAAAKAHAMQQWIWEARAYRIMAMYELDSLAAVKNLDRAEALLTAAKGKVNPIDFDEERAHILRVRIERAVAAGGTQTAQKLVAELEQMATLGSSVNTRRTVHGAAGTLLVAQKKYADAIPLLEEDVANPLSMKLLITAYRETGDAADAAALIVKLHEWKVPSIEETLASIDTAKQGSAVAAKN